MAHLLRVPEISAGTTEAVLATWPVAENSPYSATDVIATVETAKAVIDIEAELRAQGITPDAPAAADAAPDSAAPAPAAQADLPAASANGAPQRIFISPLARGTAPAARS